MFYDFLVDNEAQQGASLNTLYGLLGSAENATLFLLNGDVSYARSAAVTMLVAEKIRAGRHCLECARYAVVAPQALKTDEAPSEGLLCAAGGS